MQWDGYRVTFSDYNAKMRCPLPSAQPTPADLPGPVGSPTTTPHPPTPETVPVLRPADSQVPRVTSQRVGPWGHPGNLVLLKIFEEIRPNNSGSDVLRLEPRDLGIRAQPAWPQAGCPPPEPHLWPPPCLPLSPASPTWVHPGPKLAVRSLEGLKSRGPGCVPGLLCRPRASGPVRASGASTLSGAVCSVHYGV